MYIISITINFSGGTFFSIFKKKYSPQETDSLRFAIAMVHRFLGDVTALCSNGELLMSGGIDAKIAHYTRLRGSREEPGVPHREPPKKGAINFEWVGTYGTYGTYGTWYFLGVFWGKNQGLEWDMNIFEGILCFGFQEMSSEMLRIE